MAALNHYGTVLGRTETTRRILLDGLDANPPEKPAEGLLRSPYMGESSFDTSVVVILMALLCVLICAMGLNCIVRFALRYTRARRAALLESAEDVEATTVANTGMKQKAVRALPTVICGAAGSRLPSTDCPICLVEFLEGEEVRILPKCNHGFHVRCIDTWLSLHSSCPTCRQNLLELSRGKKKKSNDGSVDMNRSGCPAPPSTTEALHEIQVDCR